MSTRDPAERTIRRSEARRQTDATFTHGNRLTVYSSGSELYPRMLQCIRNAREAVNMEIYIFREDAVGERFVEALSEAARRGVTVRFIRDAWGSFTFPSHFLDTMEEAGVNIIRYRPISPFTGRWGWRRRDHRKLLSIDREIGFVGGINVGREYLARVDGGMGIRDTHFEVRGPAVLQINDIFSYNWQNHHHARDEYLTEDPGSEASGSCGCGPDESCARIVGGRWRQKNNILEEYLNHIRRARDRIRLTQAYFLPNRDVLEALYEARKRGCRVQLLVPGRSDVPPVQYGTRYLYEDLLDHGVEVFEYMEASLHAKTAIIDDQWVLGGTFNFDYQSIFHNLEVNLTVDSEDFAAEMNEVFEDDLAESRRVTRDQLHEWSLYERFLARTWYHLRWAL